MGTSILSSFFFPHSKCSYEIHLVFLLWLHLFLSLSGLASWSIVSAGSLIYFLLLLCLKIYDVFIPYHVSVPVIWLLVSTYLNSDKILQLSSEELFFCGNVWIWFFSHLQQVKRRTTLKSVELISDLFKGKEELQTLNLPKYFCDL